jgi:hypothetical protein
MTTSTTCYPYWHSNFAPLAAGQQTFVRSGCGVGSDGNVNCDPEAMRASAEQQLAQLGFPRSLSLETYTLARYMHGEVGNGTVEERVAVGEAAVNRAKLERTTVNGLLLFRQPQGHPNRGRYGPIHGVGAGVSTAPYGRWATTSVDPTLTTLLLADLVMSGKTYDFSNGADDQDGPEAWINQGQASLHGYVKNLANRNKFWVGPLPGIDHWHTFLQFTAGPLADKATLLQRGLEALTLPAQRPKWPADLPLCSKPAGGALLWTVAVLATIGGAWWATSRAGSRIA